VGLLGPLLGAIADLKASKKAMLGAFLALGLLSTAALAAVQRGDVSLALLAFVLGNIGVTSTLAFYNALLPGIATRQEVDRVSAAGFALGYLGGGLLLAVNLWMIAQPAHFGLADQASAMRVSFSSAALWWAVFSIPLFLGVKEPPRTLESDERPGGSVVAAACARMVETVTELRRHRDAGLMLLAFLIYNDAIATIIRMATTFGKEAGISNQALIAAILMVQFVGVPFAFAFGALADRIGPKRSILLALGVYASISVGGFWLRTAFHFFVIAFLVGAVQGGAQALSRSLFATLIPKHKAGELFGFFAAFDRFGGAMGSAVFGLVLSATGSSRPALAALLVFFLLGGLLLSRVDVQRGRLLADAESGRARVVPG
jgi:UMF1 family MFS transporter